HQMNFSPTCASRAPNSVLLAVVGTRNVGVPAAFTVGVRLIVTWFVAASKLELLTVYFVALTEVKFVQLNRLNASPSSWIFRVPPTLKTFDTRRSIVLRPGCRKALRLSNGARNDPPVPLV